jgi:hypothetical protein
MRSDTRQWSRGRDAAPGYRFADPGYATGSRGDLSADVPRSTVRSRPDAFAT